MRSVPRAVATGSLDRDPRSCVRCDPVATLSMKGRPSGDSLELFYDFKFATEGEPYENVLCGNGRASSKHSDRGTEWSRQSSDAISDRDWSSAGARLSQTAAWQSVCDV